jgi:phage protein D
VALQLSSGRLDPSVPGPFKAVRFPRLRVLADGVIVPGAFEAEVLTNSHFAADRFRVGLALSADPARGAAWWADRDDVLIDIEVSLGGNTVNLLHGGVDSVEIDLLGDAVRLTGRDLSAQLIEARAQGTFANQTSSDVAITLAGRHGLSADVQSTTTPVGRYWELEHDSLVLDGFARATTEWDLLVTLAQFEGFSVWVQGSTLHFRAADPQALPTVLPVSALSALHLERSLTLAQGIAVSVKSWHSRAAQCTVQTVAAKQANGTGGTTRNYVYMAPNLTPDRALKLAQQRLAELLWHQRVLVAEMPGELSLMPGQQILLQGSGSAFDRTYVIDSVERRLDMSHGFTQSLRAHNTGAAS